MVKAALSKDEKPAAVKSILRAANILTCISIGIDSLAGIADHCKLSKSTVHRLLKALVESHLIIEDRIRRKYFLGHLITQLLSNPLKTHEYLVVCATEEMKRIANVTQESVTLSILVGLKYVDLHIIQSTHDLRVVEENKELGSIHAGAVGKVLLSQLNRKELKIALKYMRFEPMTEYTVFNEEELLAQIKRIKQQKYAISANERYIGVMGISAPINNYVLPAALGIIGPEVRMRPNLTQFVEELMTSAAIVSDNVKELFSIYKDVSNNNSE